MTFASFHRPMGLAVRLIKPGELETKDDFLANPVLVRIVEAGIDGQVAVYVDSKKTPPEQVDGTVRKELKDRPQPMAYVEAEDSVQWADVAKIIDTIEGLTGNVVLLTTIPPNPSHIRRSGSR